MAGVGGPRIDVSNVAPNISAQRSTLVDIQLAELARRQHGVVTIDQIRELGLRTSAIGHRARTGRLHRLHRGVYAVGHRALTDEGRFLAAVLAIGPSAVLSHRAAAALWRLVDADRGDVDVTVPHRARHQVGIRVHETRRLDLGDRLRLAGIPVTTVPRTLLDLAGVADDRLLRRAVREAYVQRRVDDAALLACVAGAGRRRGARRLAALVRPGRTGTRSELEDRLLALPLARGLPAPRVNVRLGGLPEAVEVDLLFPQARLVVEADGARYHDNPVARRSDAARQAMLEEAGYRVLRVSWSQVTRRPDETVRRLRRALGE